MIVVEQRIPRTALAIVAGVAGALMQGLTPNPLADPGLLGVSDVSMWTAYALMLGFVAVLAALALWLLKRGVGLRS